mmetsp:Transcript_28993/g.52523  ORF Transcript_28993/g.52523 Transcript_28993/m.52523 type:complete len:238 (+) Transcript_28993:98-811(+)
MLLYCIWIGYHGEIIVRFTFLFLLMRMMIRWIIISIGCCWGGEIVIFIDWQKFIVDTIFVTSGIIPTKTTNIFAGIILIIVLLISRIITNNGNTLLAHNGGTKFTKITLWIIRPSNILLIPFFAVVILFFFLYYYISIGLLIAIVMGCCQRRLIILLHFSMGFIVIIFVCCRQRLLLIKLLMAVVMILLCSIGLLWVAIISPIMHLLLPSFYGIILKSNILLQIFGIVFYLVFRSCW